MKEISFLHITVFKLVSYFIIYAFLGWCTEVAYAYYKQNTFINRGFLAGPFCPIYGFGILLVLLFLEPVKNHLFLLFTGAFFITSFLEYITGYFLEIFFHARWWDYRNEPFNIKGYICLKFSIIWGAVSIFIIRLVHPFIKTFIESIPTTVGYTIISSIIMAMIIDFILTIINILKLNELLHELTERLENLDRTKIKEKILLEKNEMKEDVEEKLLETKEEIQYKLREMKNRLKQMKEEYEALLENRKKSHRRILIAFPNLNSKKFKRALEELRRRIKD